MNPSPLGLYDAILDQLDHPKAYTAAMLRMQTALHMMKDVFYLYPHLKPILQKLNMSFESFILNIITGTVYGDALVLATITRMFNIKITVLSPEYVTPWRVFHKSGNPNVILIFNGGDFSSNVPVTHISSTSK